MGIKTKYEKISRRDVDFDSENDFDEEEVVNIDISAGAGGHIYVNQGSTSNYNSPLFNNEEETTTSPDLFNVKRPEKVNFLQTAMASGMLILLYFSLSIGLTFYQSSLLEKFQYPFTVVLYHLIIKFTMAAMFRIIYSLVTKRQRVQVDCKTSLKIAPIGFASGIDIGFSNWGLELVQISLYTMTKSTSIVFILIFAILLKLEKKSWTLVSIVVLISSGLFMFTYKATQFDVLGFIFILIASFSAGIRWSFAQLYMQKSKMGLQNPIDMIYHMQPWMMMVITVMILLFESGKIAENWHILAESSFQEVFLMFLKITIGAVIAFGMEFSEFMVLSATSSLTLSVANILKEVCQLVLAVETKGDQMSFLNVIGLVLCLSGICCHVLNKYNAYLKSSKLLAEDCDQEPSDETKNYNYTNGNRPLLDREHLLETDDDDETMFDALKNQPQQKDILDDILKRRDQRR